MKLVLASSSPGRKEILEKAGFVFDVVPSNFEEDMSLQMPSHDLAMYLSKGKARDVAKKYKNTDTLVIGADSFAVFQNKFLGKPHTEERARDMLKMLRGEMHTMVSGLTLIHCKANNEITQSNETKIWFRDISDDEINEYVATGEPLTKAGGYAYEGIGNKFVTRVEGSKTNIRGMPLETLEKILEEVNYKM